MSLRTAAVTCSFGVLLLLAPAKADTIIFHDLVDTLTVEQIGTDSTIVSICNTINVGNTERCSIAVTRLTLNVDFTPIPAVYIREAGAPVGQFSDVLSPPSTISINSYSFFFDSNLDGVPISGPTNCGAPGSNCIYMDETGSVQTAFTLNWRNSAGAIVGSDLIRFESDVEGGAVPEPSGATFLIIVPLLLVAGLMKYRKTVTSA